MNNVGSYKRKSGLGYIFIVMRYQAINCKDCLFGSRCTQAKDNLVIEVNHKLNEYKREAREVASSEGNLLPGEAMCGAVLAQIKHNWKFNSFKLRGLQKVNIEFTLVAIAYNLKK
ncbi:MAG: transposase [Bacteroidales bacterium]|nr:transposase [Bacteroidales bacterium]